MILFWRPPIYLYLSIFFTLLLVLRRGSIKYCLVSLPILAQSLIMVLVNLAQDFRYQYSIYLVCLLFLGFIYQIPQQKAALNKEKNIET